MNERIEELIKQSYFYDEPNDSTIFDKEKFAELIVRECIAQCNDGDSRWFIAQHFGVEE